MYIIGKEEIDALTRVIESGHLFRYRDDARTETDLLETELAAFMGAPHALALSSGTAALICGLAGMGVGPGDEVIVPAYTFISTALAPLALGAVPVIADINESLTLDPDDCEQKITGATRVIMPVHMMGLPCEMDRILDIARRHNLNVLEDACQADGGSYRGQRLGTLGDAGAYSFNHYKIISAGESGALVTKQRDLFERARIQHDGGCVFFSPEARAQQVPWFAGWNFRISELLSCVVRVQLTRLDTILQALRTEKTLFSRALAECSAMQLNPVHDREGDCGVVTACLFDTAETARRFITCCHKHDIEAQTPADSGRHIYTNWEPVLKQRGAHTESRNPFSLTKQNYSHDQCIRTLRILERTVYLSPSATRSAEESRHLAARIGEAVQALGA